MKTPPPNPHGDEARAAMREYAAEMGVNVTCNYTFTPDTAPALSDALPLVAERLRGLTVNMSTARVEKLQHASGWCWCVTVTA